MASASSTVSLDYKGCGIAIKSVIRQCILCDVWLSNQHTFEACKWTWPQTSSKKAVWYYDAGCQWYMRYCKLCNYVKLPGDAQVQSHINGKYHHTQVEQIQFSDEYSTATENASLLKMTGVLCDGDGTRVCILCDYVQLPGKSQLESHTNGRRHQFKLEESGIEIRNGIRYCTLCDAWLPGDSQLESHVNGSSHQSKIQSTTESDYDSDESEYEETTSAASTDFTNNDENDDHVIETEYGHYCTLCDAKLISEHNYYHHVKGLF